MECVSRRGKNTESKMKHEVSNTGQLLRYTYFLICC